eukprot:6167788-Ditylum_brightwellii.AAC.1
MTALPAAVILAIMPKVVTLVEVMMAETEPMVTVVKNLQIIHYYIQSLINVTSSTTDPWGEEDHNLADPSAIQCVNTILNPDMVAAASATFCCGEGVVPVVQSHWKRTTQHEEEGAVINYKDDEADNKDNKADSKDDEADYENKDDADNGDGANSCIIASGE